MVSLRKILVGADIQSDLSALTPSSRRALRSAMRLARQTRAQLTVMTFLRGPAMATDELVERGSSGSNTEARVRELHAEMADEYAADGGNVVSRIVHGQPAEQLIREVLREGMDLLVAGAKRHSPTMNLLFGSTSLTLLRQCPCPLWIPREGSFDGEQTTIVAADELADVGEKVLQFAVTAAQLTHSRLLVLHAAQFPLEGGLIRTESPRYDIFQYKQKVREEAELELIRRLSRTDYRTIQAGTMVAVEAGDPEVVIGQTVRNYHADLLVVGTHGRNGLSALLVGNSVERILADVPCSVLAIKPDDFVCPVRSIAG